MSVSGLRSLLLIGLAILTSRAGFAAPPDCGAGNPTTFQFVSQYIAAEVSLRQPAFRALSVDGLGLGEFAASSLRMPPKTDTGRQGRQPNASYRSVCMARSRWSLHFVKKLTILEVSSIVVLRIR